MDFDVLDLIDDAAAESNAFEAHPAGELSLEDQLHYLNGLALIMSSDKHIDEAEIEYIKILIKSFSLDESLIDDVLAFAKAPDKASVQAFFKAFRHKSIAQVFIFDALTMAFRDDELKDVEKSAIDKIAHQLGLMKGTVQDIFDLFCHIKHNNWEESALYFDSFLLKKEHFEHLLTYYGVDYDALLEGTKSLRIKRLQQLISAKLIVSDNNESEGNDVSEEIGLTHDVVIPMLQAELDRGLASVVNETLTIKGTSNDSSKNEVFLNDFEFSKYGIKFDNITAQLVTDSFIRINDKSLDRYFSNRFFEGEDLYGREKAYELMKKIPTIIAKSRRDGLPCFKYQLSTPVTGDMPYIMWDGLIFHCDLTNKEFIYMEEESCCVKNFDLKHSEIDNYQVGSMRFANISKIRQIYFLYDAVINDELTVSVINHGKEFPEEE
jgi:uncharacterized tellurite resistance protein B-like protein